MRTLSAAEYDRLVQDGTVLARNEGGGLTLRGGDGTYLKVFRRPGLLSSGRLWPLSRRFVRAAGRLRQRGIATVEVIERIRIPHLRTDAVRYRGLPGMTLADRLNDRGAGDGPDPGELLRAFAGFVARLHANGVYFRGLRFANVIANDEWFGLIDVAAASFRRGRLSPSLRARNFHHFLRYDSDRATIVAAGFAGFLRGYLDAAFLPPAQARRLLRSLRRAEPGLVDDIDRALEERS